MVQVADCGSVYEKLQEEASKEYPENEFQKRLETEKYNWTRLKEFCSLDSDLTWQFFFPSRVSEEHVHAGNACYLEALKELVHNRLRARRLQALKKQIFSLEGD